MWLSGLSWLYPLDGLLDPVGGAIVAEALSRIEDELFGADWAEARHRLGDSASAADPQRSPAQRRAGALVEMARWAGALPGGTRLPEPLFTVLADYPTFTGRVCELADGTVVTPWSHRGRSPAGSAKAGSSGSCSTVPTG